MKQTQTRRLLLPLQSQNITKIIIINKSSSSHAFPNPSTTAPPTTNTSEKEHACPAFYSFLLLYVFLKKVKMSLLLSKRSRESNNIFPGFAIFPATVQEFLLFLFFPLSECLMRFKGNKSWWNSSSGIRAVAVVVMV